MKMVKLSNGKVVDFDVLYPVKESVYHEDEYCKEDDIYNSLLTKEEKEKYGIH